MSRICSDAPIVKLFIVVNLVFLFLQFFFSSFFPEKKIRVKHSLSAVSSLSTGQRIFYEIDLRGLSFTSRLNHPGRQPNTRSLEVSQLVVACATV